MITFVSSRLDYGIALFQEKSIESVWLVQNVAPFRNQWSQKVEVLQKIPDSRIDPKITQEP